MNMLLGHFNANLRKEDVFISVIGNETLHETSNDNGVRVVNLNTSKNPTVKSIQCPHISSFINTFALS
jgi:hypothetical protein